MLIKFRQLTVITIAILLAFSAPSAAQDDSAEQRINLSGKLRMLSQRIPSAACHLAKGIDTEAATTLLLDASAEFDSILNALEKGDNGLNISKPEARKKTLAQISDLRGKWGPMKDAASALAEGSATEAQLNYIFSENMTVLGAAVGLVSELVKQYSNPNAVSQANLMLVDISGRQRMLTQKMSKESCIAGTDFATATTLDDMNSTMQVFEASLEALKFGMPAVGINPPPNGAISAELDLVSQDWAAVKPLLINIGKGETLEKDKEAFKFQQLNKTMATMNTTVGLYVQAVKPKSTRLN